MILRDDSPEMLRKDSILRSSSIARDGLHGDDDDLHDGRRHNAISGDEILRGCVRLQATQALGALSGRAFGESVVAVRFSRSVSTLFLCSAPILIDTDLCFYCFCALFLLFWRSFGTCFAGVLC